MTNHQHDNRHEAINALLLHVDRYGDNEHLMHPFAQGDYWCATDSLTAIYIPKGQYRLGYDERKRPLMLNILPKYAPTHKVALADMDAVLSRANIEDGIADIRCPECDDNAEVQWTYTDQNGHTYYENMECPRCNGYSFIKNGSSANIAFGKYAVPASSLVRLLHTMRIAKVEYAQVTIDGCKARFDLPNGFIVLAALHYINHSECLATLKLTPNE